MPTDPTYVAPRVEPVQLSPGQSKLGIYMPFKIATIGINNYSEFFAFIQPQSRPGFWVSPYTVGMYVPLYPPADSINVTQSRVGPNGTSGVISNFGAGSLDLWFYDAPLSPDPGIISGPDALLEEVTAIFDIVANFGGTVNVVLANPGQNLIIRRLAITSLMGGTGVITLSPISASWQELPPPAAPAQPFSWSQALSTEGSPYTTDTFEPGTAIIHANSFLTVACSPDYLAYYITAAITAQISCEVQFFRVNA